jgi:hypothetical protein
MTDHCLQVQERMQLDVAVVVAVVAVVDVDGDYHLPNSFL